MFKVNNASGCAFARVLPSNHPFMSACRRGDVIDVRHMLQNGEGRVSDLDERRWTPLAVSQRLMFAPQDPADPWLLKRKP